MSTRDSYAPGTPNWVDIGATDVEATIRFYCELLGWTTAEAGPAEETGGYGFFMLGDRIAAGYGPAQAPGVWWTTYVSVEDVADSVARVTEAGGTVLMEPMDVLDAGRMAVVSDPVGATFSLWQPGTHIGSQVFDEPGAFCWTELRSRDIETARRFYRAVFGWEGEPYGPDLYTAFVLDGSIVAGAMAMPERVPAEVLSYWDVYFAVVDLEASTVKLVELGGTLATEPMEAEGVGRFIAAMGPHGEAFSLIQLAQPS